MILSRYKDRYKYDYNFLKVLNQYDVRIFRCFIIKKWRRLIGIIDWVKRKIGNKMEYLGKKGMTEEERKAYEEERAHLIEKRKEPDYIDEIFSKDGLNNLEALLTRIGALDDKKIWISGFQQQRSNQNAKAAKLFTGKKNMRFLTYNDNKFYMLSFDKDRIKSSRVFVEPLMTKVTRFLETEHT